MSAMCKIKTGASNLKESKAPVFRQNPVSNRLVIDLNFIVQEKIFPILTFSLMKGKEH